ncbi:MAG: aminotransferase class I/II-fold pyridoxal phosphate-dependent enzyme [Candidatus Bathyarchaeia archaeon]
MSRVRVNHSVVKTSEEMIDLEAGDPYLHTPENVREAGKKAIDEGYTHYLRPPETLQLREAVAKMLKFEAGINVDSDGVRIMAGGLNAIFSSMVRLIDPGDEVLMPNPNFPRFEEFTRICRGVPVFYHLLEKDGWRPDVTEIERKINPKTKILVIITPNNPTGGVIDIDDLRAIAEAVVENDIYVIADEMYYKMVYPPNKHISIASLKGMEDKTVTIGGLTKAYSMCGWRIAWVASHNTELVEKIDFWKPHTVCSISQMAALEALLGSQKFVEDSRLLWMRHRDIAYKRLTEIGFECFLAQGGFYLFPNHSMFIDDSNKFIKYMREVAKVKLASGIYYGRNGYFRFGFTCQPIQTMEEGLNRIEKAIKKLENKNQLK